MLSFAFAPVYIGLGFLGAATAGDGDESLARLEMKPVEVELRDGGTLTVFRGDLKVPIVRANPESKEITVDVWRFPALEGADPDAPPIFKLHGGPGWPGMEMVPGAYERAVMPTTKYADLVVVGQRGIGSSKPNTTCAPIPATGKLKALTQEESDAALVKGCKSCREHWEEQGYDITGLNVVEAAADVDDIRRLLGYDKIVLWGGSFGSHWSMAVMRYFPDGVARAALHGIEGPDHTYDSPSGVLGALERLAAEADISPQFEGRVPPGGLMEAFKTVIEFAEMEPIEVEVDGETVKIDADDLRSACKGYTNSTSSRRGARSWAADMLALYEGKFERAARAKMGDSRGVRGLPTASFFMLDCGSGISPERLETLKNDPAVAVVGDQTKWYQTACSAWNSDLGESFRAGFTTEIPTLMVQGSWDTSTPMENAVEILPFFENLHFVLVDGGSHGAMSEAMDYSEEFHDAVMAFFTKGDMSGLPLDVRMPPLDWTPPY